MRRPQEDLHGCGVGWGAWAEPLMSSWGWGKWQEGGGLFLVGCPQILPHPSLMSTKAISKHVSLFWRKQSLPSSYSINFVEYVSSIGVQSSALFIPCSVYPPIQPAVCSSIHPLTNPSIHPPIHSLTHQIISDPPRRQRPPLLLLPGGPPA